MGLSKILGVFAITLALLTSSILASPLAEAESEKTIHSSNTGFVKRSAHTPRHWVRSPKIMIVSMFPPEAEVWYEIPEFDLLAVNISLPGLSPLFPHVHCTWNGDVCQFIIGESEINAASSVMALALSPIFDFTKTYWLIAGIAGINPEIASICSVTFAKYAVQVALQYEFDVREIPANYTTGYIPFGVTAPDEYPTTLYGTEVFEVNEALQHIAVAFAKTAVLNDSDAAVLYRANYASAEYALGAKGPGVYACDGATSDVYYSGVLLGEAFGNFTRLMTNGSGVYCATAQEDNATLEVLLRATLAGLADFSRIIVMRTASDFDRPYPGESALQNLFFADQGAFVPATQNLYLAGIKVVMGILHGWDHKFEAGIPATNYLGDIFGSLGGTPDFGPADGEAHFGKRNLEDGARGLSGRHILGGNVMGRRQQRAGIRLSLPQDL